MIRLTVLLLLLSLLGACSFLDRVIPDRRTEYQAARTMPDLEVPPDLTAENPNNDMDVPGQQGASLSRFQRSRSAGNGGSGSSASTASSAASPAQSGGGTGKALDSQQWVSVSGTAAQAWPKIAAWFKDQNMQLVLNDAGLGVMETDWGQPVTQNGTTYRDKYQIVSQSGADADTTVLFITDIRQEQVGKPGGGTEWVKQGESSAAEKALAGRLNVFLNGSNATADTGSGPAPGTAAAADTGTAAPAKRAEMQDTGDNRQALNLPDDYHTAWENTRTVLERVGLPVTHTDDQKGLYYISYHDRDKPRDDGLLSKLAFWKSDKQEGIPYVLSLKDDGDHTRLVVLNVKGDWIGNDDTSHILTLIQTEYNRL